MLKPDHRCYYIAWMTRCNANAKGRGKEQCSTKIFLDIKISTDITVWLNQPHHPVPGASSRLAYIHWLIRKHSFYHIILLLDTCRCWLGVDTRVGKIFKTSIRSLLQEALALPRRSFWILPGKLDLLPVDSLLALFSESPTDCGLHSCFHCTLFFALSKPCTFLPCNDTSLIAVSIIFSPGLLLKPPNSSPLQLLTLLHFCQRDLSRSKSDCTHCLLQTLP